MKISELKGIISEIKTYDDGRVDYCFIINWANQMEYLLNTTNKNAIKEIENYIQKIDSIKWDIAHRSPKIRSEMSKILDFTKEKDYENSEYYEILNS